MIWVAGLEVRYLLRKMSMAIEYGAKLLSPPSLNEGERKQISIAFLVLEISLGCCEMKQSGASQIQRRCRRHKH